MTFLEIKQQVADNLNDPRMEYFTDDILGRYVNNGLRELQKFLVKLGQDWYVKCAESVTVADQEIYQFPSDFVKVVKFQRVVEDNGAQTVYADINPIVRSQVSEFARVGEPQAYYLDRYYFHLVPIPQQVWELHLQYSYRVAVMVDDAEVPDCPPQYEDYIIIMATIYGLGRDQQDPSTYLKIKQDYEDLMTKDAQQRKIDRSRQVNQSTAYRYGGF